MQKDVKVQKRARGRATLSFGGPKGQSRTKQSFAAGTRVDAILKKYATVGVDANDVGLFGAQVARMPFGEGETAYDYQVQLNRVIAVKEYFERLPSGVRERFNNDPAVMLSFMADWKNKDECVKLGLFRSDKEPEKAKEPAKEPAKDEKEAKPPQK